MVFGAEYRPGQGVRFRLWGPKAEKVALHLSHADRESTLAVHATGEGWFELTTDLAGPGTRYQYEIDGGKKVPDPASRFQPADVHGPSEVIDHTQYQWRANWRGRAWQEATVLELHVGTFTPAGTFRGVIDKLDHVRKTGLTAIELMPIADFAGRWNWGYDGVLLYAPDNAYGRPDDLKLLIDEAQEMSSSALSELRLLSSTELDSRSILTTVLAGDHRLANRLEGADLLPIASRIRARLRTEALTPAQLLQYLNHLLKMAGNPKLMNPSLLQTLCEHAAGNLRLLMNMANDLLAAAVHQEREQIDEKLFFEVFSLDPKPAPKRS